MAVVAQSPLSAPVAPPQNPTTAAKSVLGKLLFHEEQLASNGRMACGTCHRPQAGGGDLRRQRHPGPDGLLATTDDTFGSPGLEKRAASGAFVADPVFGFEAQVTPRAAPGIAMAAYFDELFWDGRVDDVLRDPITNTVVIPAGAALESLALHPLRNEVEMSRPGRGWPEIVQRLVDVRPLALASNLPADLQLALAGSPGYPALFAAAFGDAAITPPRIAMALASYLRSVVPDQTPWDLHAVGVPNALTPNQLAGLQLFENEARCNLCHPLGLFTDRSFRALGLAPVAQDPGRSAVTGLPGDAGRFKVPSLRNVALKTTFMHNGRFTSLLQVVNFYRNGGGSHPPLDSQLQAFVLDQVQTQQLLDFLENGLVDPRARLGAWPFDRPTLFGESSPVGSNELGVATTAGGVTPRLRAQVPPYFGNAEWVLGLTDGLSGGASLFVVSLAPAAPGAFVQGVALHVDPGSLFLSWPAVNDGSGAASLVLPVPLLPGLSGLPLYAQGLSPVGSAWAGSRGAVLTLR